MTSKTVAVIAVHGVADQEPCVSARQIAGMLAELDAAGGAPVYGPFAERAFRLPVRRLEPPDTANGSRASFYEMAAKTSAAEIDQQFIESQLSLFSLDDPAAHYQTIRLEAPRRDGGAVHVYEMYWADLSRLGTGVVRVLGELYQVLLHVGSLGKHVTSALASEPSAAGFWLDVLRQAQRAAAWVFAVPIVILNLLCIIPALIVLSSRLNGAVAEAVAVGVATLATGVLGGVAALRVVRRMHWLLWALLPAVAAGLAFMISRLGVLRMDDLLLADVVVVSGAIFTVQVLKYNHVRPHAALFALPAGTIVVAVVLAFWIARRGEDFPLVRAGFGAGEIVFDGLVAAWAVFFLLAFVAHGAGTIVNRQTTGEARGRVRRAIWTARITLALPAIAFISVTTVLWGAINIAVGTVPAFQYYARYAAIALGHGHEEHWSMKSTDFVEHLLVESVGPGFALVVILIGIAAAFSAWAVAPIVWTEVRTPRQMSSSDRFGCWLDYGWWLLRWGGRLIVVAVLFVWPLTSLTHRAWGDDLLPDALANALPASDAIIKWAAALLAGSTVGLLAFRGRLDWLALGFRAPLDVMLDVDNYLRQDPRRDNPKARMFARYASLLRFVRDYRDARGQPYAGVVIVAHSQGTVLSADLLRFLKSAPARGWCANENWPGWSIPVTLFTMGSPLRQLYGLRFPHLYAWARHEEALPCQPIPPPIAPTLPPDPSALLGVDAWVNVYRSGDYVGRWLWRPDACEHNYAVNVESESMVTPVRREFCIGGGAHTHYWDASAPRVAEEVDALIAARLAGAPAET